MKNILFKSLCIIVATTIFCMCSKESSEDDLLIVSLNKEEITLEVGKSERLIASFTPSDAENTGHTWVSSNANVASVDETGLISAKSVGTATITVNALSGGSKATCLITVVEKVIPVTSIKLSSTEEFILIGDTKKLTATISPDNATDKSVVWSSSANNVATVSDNGEIIGLSEGETTITAKTSNGKTATCKITVGGRNAVFTNTKATVIDDKSINVTSNITPQGIEPKEIGVCYSTDKTPTIQDKKKVAELDYSVNCILNDLTPNTKYFIRVYVKTNNNVFYSNTIEGSTTGSIITNFVVTDVYRDKLIFKTPLIPGIYTLNYCYGIASNPEITDNIGYTSKTSDGYYIIELRNLTSDKNYYIRAYTKIGSTFKYYESESHAKTLSSNEIYRSETSKISSSSDYYYCTICYHLPNGTYEVITTTDYISKTIPKSTGGAHSIYIEGGSGKFYQISNTAYSTTFKEVTFKNLGTDITYHL